MKKKIDLYTQFKPEYAAPKSPVLLKVSPARYLSISGTSEPGGAEFEKKISALYSVAFTIKMTKKAAGQDYAVSKLECLWPKNNRSLWVLAIRTPDFIGAKEVRAAIAALNAKGKDPEVAEVEILRLKESRCVQMLHVGPYDKVGVTIEKLLAFAKSQGLAFRDALHEIYLSDPRRVAASKLRTILRHPVK